MHSLRRSRFLLLAIAALTPGLGATARPASLVKHTVSGSGTFEQGRRQRAEVNRATFHPIDHHFALSVFGRMGWVITGQWRRDGDEVALVVANMNNTPARGSGDIKLDGRGNVEAVKISGTSQGGAYRVKFKAGAPSAATEPSSVRLGPSSGAPRSDEADFRGRERFDRSRHGRGVLTFSGAAPVPIGTAEVDLSSGGRIVVRADAGGASYRFEGTAGSSGSREELDLVLTSSGGGGVVTGSAKMDRAGRSVEALRLQGWLRDRPFQLEFRAGR